MNLLQVLKVANISEKCTRLFVKSQRISILIKKKDTLSKNLSHTGFYLKMIP